MTLERKWLSVLLSLIYEFKYKAAIQKGYSKMNKLEDFSKFDGIEIVDDKFVVNENISESTL